MYDYRQSIGRHRTSLFWKQVSKFFTLCFHENSLRQPKALPFRSALFRPRSFFSSRKPRAVTWGRHSGGAGWIGETLMTRFNIHLRFLWHPRIEVCVFYRPRHSCSFVFYWKKWCLDAFKFWQGSIFSLVAVVSRAYSARPIYILEDLLANFLVICKLFTDVRTKHAPGINPKNCLATSPSP